MINEPPETPHTPFPAESTTRVTVVSGNVDLSWQSSDPNVGDAVLFDVYLGTAPGALSLISSGNTNNSYTASLAEGMTYYWQVVANDYEFSTTGPIWSFTTDGPPPDLSVSSFTSSPPGHVNEGNIVTFTATIVNQGAGAMIDALTMELVMDNVVFATANIDTILLASETVEISGTWVYAEGVYILSATVDTLDTVTETDETNNTLTMVVTDIVDQEPPQLVSSWPAQNSFVRQADHVSFTLVDRHNLVDVQTTLDGFRMEGSNGEITGSIIYEGNNFIFTPDTALADDSYTVTISVADNLTNSGQRFFVFVVDSVPPAKPIITGGTVASGLIQERPTLNIIHLFIAPLTGTREADTSLWVNGEQIVSVGSSAWATQLSLLVGDNTMEVWSVDRAGNESTRAWVDIRLESEKALELEYDYSGSGRLKSIFPVNRY